MRTLGSESRKRAGSIPRREFLASTGAALAVPYFVPSTALAGPDRPGANDRLTVAHIGVGGMGTGHLNRMTKFREEGRVNIAAVCDVDEKRLANAVQTAGVGVTPYRDYRYICQRKDIDAVVIATPDHWHAVQTVHACQTGKHVYVVMIVYARLVCQPSPNVPHLHLLVMSQSSLDGILSGVENFSGRSVGCGAG